MVTKKEMSELSKVHDTCVSVFIPTHRRGEETLKGEDAIKLKAELKQVKQELEKQGMSGRQLEQFLKPAEDLVKDSDFWRHQSDGLALFMADGFFKKYTVPDTFEPFHYVSNEFYLKPLMPLFNNGHIFYLLTLKMDEVKLYEATQHSITEIIIDDVVPSQLEDRVGYDYEQKTVQFRTQQGNRGQGMYHGHQDDDSETKNELLRFFNAVDKGITCTLRDQEPPLVVACLDYQFPLYKEACTYQNLYEPNISGNPADKDIFLLHEEAVDLLEPFFSKEFEEKKERIAQFLGTGKASADVREILSFATGGMVDTVFIDKNEEIFGAYDINEQKMEVAEVHSSSNISLTNMVATQVFEQGGKVYLLDKEDMPDKSSPMNALFRN